jgi:DNA repair protein RecO (recombination protein O)
MLQKTRGIVFHSTEYGETSLIVKIYTEHYGIQSYIINSVRKKHARVHAGIFQPLSPVDLVVYHKERQSIHRIADIRANPPLENIPFDIYKSTIVFFLDEVLYKSIREEEANRDLFEFLLNAVVHLDKPRPLSNCFHLVFLLHLSRHLGFAPSNNNNATNTLFNLLEGKFQDSFPAHPHFIPKELSEKFALLMEADYTSQLDISAADRRSLSNYLIEFFTLHVDGFGNIKSQQVLEQVWD